MRNAYGEYLTTTDALDLAIRKYLPASIDDMRGIMAGITAAEDDYRQVGAVSEFLIMVAATAPDLARPSAPDAPWKASRFAGMDH
jgi:hypothetical protein